MDGDRRAPKLVKDIKPGSESSGPSGLFVAGTEVFFSASTAEHGRELWKSDGTEAGTVLVADIRPGPDSSEPAALTLYGGQLYFSAQTAEHGRELWKSDGTEAGTMLVADIEPGPLGSSVQSLRVVPDGTGGSLLAFTAYTADSGREPWMSRGTADTTERVADLNPGVGSSDPTPFAVVEGLGVFFAASDGTAAKLWRFDPSAGPPTPIDVPNALSLSALTPFDGKLYFRANTTNLGNELGVYDGTPLTPRVIDLEVGAESSTPTGLVAGEHSLFFLATVAERGDLNTDTADSSPAYFVEFNGEVYFSADDGVHGVELWAFDGENIRLVKDINPGIADGAPSQLTVVGDTLFFIANDGVHHRDLWKSDGTEAGTVLVKDIAAGSTTSSIEELFAYGDKLLFMANDWTHGHELWISDGTAAGTSMVRDINEGGGSSSPRSFVELDGIAYFVASDGFGSTYGREIWEALPRARR